MTHIIRVLILFLCLGWSVLAQSNPKPFVIPELTEWQGAEGEFSPSGRIVLSSSSKELRAVAEELANDYRLMFGRQLRIVRGSARAGDFVLSLKPDHALGLEGYHLSITEVTRLTAATAQGLFWGTRTVLQLSEQHERQALPQGQTTDTPRYAMRGLLLDVARKYIPMDYLHRLVKVMAYYKMNTLQVHLNDNGFKDYFGGDWAQTSSAFRLESEIFPNLAIKGASYSKQEFIDFQERAMRQFVEIIPEIDVPAHSLAFSRIIPEIGSKEYGMDHLDLFNPKTYEFVDALFHEYLSGDKPVFRGRRVNIGTDEYSNAKEEVRERFRYFTDRYIKYVQSFGKQACLWGALTHAYGKTPVASQDVVMMCWYNGYADPTEMKKQGYQIVSIPDGWTYIVPGAGYYYDYLDTERLHKFWTPAQIGNQRFEEQDSSLLGGMFAVWNDHYGNGITVKDIHHRLMPALQMIALKTWTAHSTTIPYADYERQRPLLSEAPGVNELARLAAEPAEVYSQASFNPRSELPYEEIGYNYTVSWDMELADELIGTELFRSAHAVFYLTSPQNGQLGFLRDGYLDTFDYTLPKTGKVQIAIQGTNKGTALYINGKLRQRLDIQTVYVPQQEEERLNTLYQAPDSFSPTVYRTGKKMHYHRTLVFPLRRAGEFNSNITNLKVYNYLLHKQ